ncbi:MAG: penicillin-binding protein 2 [Anaerolineales bacterium]|nr:penicillin-binding protein 2 [Anaerolineales bacterium]
MGSSNNRLFIVLAVLVIVSGLVIARLIELQVIQSGEIEQEHEKIYGGVQELQPIRGLILDRNDAVLAVTGYEYRVSAAPNQIEDSDVRSVASVLSTLLVTRTYNLLPILAPAALENESSSLYAVVAPRVSSEVADAIREAELPGIYLEPVPSRDYPHGRLLCHVLGWVDMDMNGNSGVEGYYDEELTGKPVTVSQYPFLHGSWQTARPHHGATLVLTIDRTIQMVTEEVLSDALVRYSAPSGSIIVMDLDDFGILAMANYPTFNPNEYYKEDPENLVNPSISEWFEPGSVHKVLTMASAIDSGAVTPQTTYQDTGMIEVGGVPIYNWDRAAHGTTDMITLLAKSLNVGAATLARWMGQQQYYQYAQDFGLVDYTGIDLEAEISGMLKRPGDSIWTESDLGTNSFGQGLAVTPLRELISIAAIANEGVMMQPHVVAEIRDEEQVSQFRPIITGQPISAETARTVSLMMEQAVEQEVTTASVPGYSVAGKTGTAQIAEGGIYHPTDIIGTFVGFFPVQDPQVIVFVKIDRPQISQNERWGSTTAAPTFAELAKQLVILLDIPPDSVRLEAKVQ